MKPLLSSFLLATLVGNFSFANCDFSKIKKLDDNYLYSKELHICVGELKRDLSISKSQNEKLLQAIVLKDLVIDKTESRANLWEKTSSQLENRINSIDNARQKDRYLYFGLGVLSVLGASYVASQLLRR